MTEKVDTTEAREWADRLHFEPITNVSTKSSEEWWRDARARDPRIELNPNRTEPAQNGT